MKTLLISRISLIGFVIISLLSCEKAQDEAPGYYVKFKKSDAWVTWTNAVGEVGKDLADGSKINLGVSAHNGDYSEVLDLTIQAGEERFRPGVYHSENYFTRLVYSDHFGAPGGALYTTTEAREDGPRSSYTIRIIEVTPKTLKGHFFGNFLTSRAGSEIKSTAITEGEFFVSRIR